jgi:hypothetical protein
MAAVRILLIGAVLAASLHAQPDPAAVLLRVRDRVLNTLDRLPRYLCTQTVDRSQYEPAGLKGAASCDDAGREPHAAPVLATADRLRLDVGVAQGTEAYSWVRENRFGDQSLFQIVKEGALSTGYFQGFLSLIFRQDHADFAFAGETTEGGRKLLEYTFTVPLNASHYIFRKDSHAYTTAYEGRLLADPETADLVSLSARTLDLPSEMGSCEVSTAMKYGRLRVNGADFLLPTETEMNIRDSNGIESHNRTVYTGCHEFLGESTIRFEPPPGEAPQGAAKAAGAAGLPGGLPFTVRLAQEIAVATAAAGDPVQGVLLGDLGKGREVFARKGEPVNFRIVRIRRFYNARRAGALVELYLRLENLGGRPVAARPYVRPVVPPRRGALAQRPVPLGPLPALEDNLWFTRFEKAGDDYVIKPGMPIEWMTSSR